MIAAGRVIEADEIRRHRLSRIATATTTPTTPRRTCSARTAELVWHKDTDLKGADVVILPGGFAHGDYLRTGAIARFSPIMRAVRAFADARRPGARHLQRLPDPARGRAAARRDAAQPRPEVPLRARARPRRADRHAVHAPRAAGARCCGCRSRTARATTSPPPDVIARLEANRQVVFRYTDAAGRRRPTRPIRTARLTAIAGLCNEARNVVGLMPHPERACEPALGSADGLRHLRVGRAVAVEVAAALRRRGCDDR